MNHDGIVFVRHGHIKITRKPEYWQLCWYLGKYTEYEYHSLRTWYPKRAIEIIRHYADMFSEEGTC